MEEKQIYGGLFDSIPLSSKEHLDTLIDTINEELALYYLIQSVNYAYKSGIYTLGESEVISKSIRILTQKK